MSVSESSVWIIAAARSSASVPVCFLMISGRDAVSSMMVF